MSVAGEIARGAEAEPGLVWPSPSAAPNATPATDAGGRALTDRLLERLGERLTSIESLQVQTLRRIEGLDYR